MRPSQLSPFSVNLLAFYHECRSLIGYALVNNHATEIKSRAHNVIVQYDMMGCDAMWFDMPVAYL